ncbi:MAG: SAM-dependent methyltransferase [Desulfobacteraceae bacterium]|nr:SAM-dependent methyltransferase [Desulfobacteraceae bacterium]
MNATDWNPGTLLQTSGYYWKTCTLHTGVKLDIFSIINNEKLSVKVIAKKISGDERGVGVLLNALAAMGLLKKEKDLYSNTPEATTFLSKHSDQYLGFMIMHHHHLMESWNKMDQAIIEGKPISTRSSFSDDKRRESFLMGMFNSAMAIAPKLSKIINLEGCTSLLDFGGGPGTFAIHFCMQNPKLKAKIFDLPTTRPFAEKIIKRFNMSDRVEFISGNFVDKGFNLKEKFDATWLSHILHGEGPEDAQAIIEKAVSALKSGGKIFIHEFILNSNMDSPLFPALFSINMLVRTPNGQSYSQNQLSDMLTKKGVVDIQRLDFVGPTESGILVGIKS